MVLMWNPVYPRRVAGATSITISALERAFGHPPWTFKKADADKLAGMAACMPEIGELADALAQYDAIAVEVDS